MRQAYCIQVAPQDFRYFEITPEYRIGHYLEKDKPYPDNTRAILCIYRVPKGAQAPVGRVPDAELLKLAIQSTQVAEPEVLARFPYWMEIIPPVDLPDSTDIEFEPVQILPPSQLDRQGSYVEPPNSMTPVETPAEPVDTAPAAKTGKAGK